MQSRRKLLLSCSHPRPDSCLLKISRRASAWLDESLAWVLTEVALLRMYNKCVQQPAGFRHFTEVCEVDSPVSRRFPPIRLKNRRTFALFTRSFRAWLFASLDFPRVYTTQNRGKCKSRTEAGSVELCNKGPVTIWLDSADV